MQVIDSLPWLLSAITIVGTWLQGSKARYAWLISLGNQGLWLIWVVATGTWGFLPLTIVMAAIFLRNHIRWNRMP